MPGDLQNYGIERGDSGQVTTPIHVISGQLVIGGVVAHDFTGPNAIRWQACLAQLPLEQQDEIAAMVANVVIQAIAGQG